MKLSTLCRRSALAAAISGLLVASAWANHPDDKLQKMDTNGDGKISASEHSAGARKMFQEMDGNSDGRVTATEMDSAHKGMKGEGKDGKKDKPMMSSAEKIRSIDSDGDGVITAQEHEAAARSKFEKMDTNQDGSLTAEELRAGHDRMK